MKAVLWNWTPYPVETIYCEWLQSRSDGPVPTPQEVRERIRREHTDGGRAWLKTDPPTEFEREVRQAFERGIEMKVPMNETIHFLWLFEDVSVSWREQAVRHQIGHKFGGAAGFDQLPDLAGSSFWVQSMRQKDMGKFADKEQYYLPETVLGNKKLIKKDYDITVEESYKAFMQQSQEMYKLLVEADVPLEDARNVLPMGCTHRLVWNMNWTSMTALLSKRSCWIAQLGMWEPVITQMLEELRTKVDPYFARLGDPPCIGKDDKFHKCPFELENIEYIHGRDPHHPCPLWTHNQRTSFWNAVQEAESPTWQPASDGNEYCIRPMIKKTAKEEMEDRNKRTARYAVLWGRDPRTGERKALA